MWIVSSKKEGMTVIEKEKYRLIQEILNDTDEKRILKVTRLYHKKSSFMCSEDELRESVRQQIEDMKTGKMEFIPHEQLKRKVV